MKLLRAVKGNIPIRDEPNVDDPDVVGEEDIGASSTMTRGNLVSKQPPARVGDATYSNMEAKLIMNMTSWNETNVASGDHTDAPSKVAPSSNRNDDKNLSDPPRSLLTSAMPHRLLALGGGFQSNSCEYEPSRCICLGALEATGFDIKRTSRAEKWMDGDSVVELAEAGRYVGLEDIPEYVDFSSSPLLIQPEEHLAFEIVPIPESISFEPSTRECTVTAIMPTCDTLSEMTKGGSIDYYKALKLVFKVKYMPSQQKRGSISADILVKRAHVYFPPLFYDIFDEVIRTEQIVNEFCDIMESKCPQIYANNFPIVSTNNDTQTCPDAMFSLEKSKEGVLDGNTFGCRILHGELARNNQDHCPHISFIPEEDKKGLFKCQKSRGVAPSELFSELEIETFQTYISEHMSFNMEGSMSTYYKNSSCRDRYPEYYHKEMGFPAIASIVLVSFLGLVLMAAYLTKIRDSKVAKKVEDLSHTPNHDGKYDSDIGIMVSKVVAIELEDSYNESKRWAIVIYALFAAIITGYFVIALIVLIVIHPNLSEPNNVNMVLFNEFAIPLDEAKWSITNSNPLSLLEPDNFILYLCILVWLPVVLAGVGLEVFSMVTRFKGGWKRSDEYHWRLTNLLYPTVGMVTYGLAASHNFVAILFAVLLFWMFGFPETIAPMYLALFDPFLDRKARVCHIFDSVGLLWHHSGGALVICQLVTGIVRSEPSVLDPILALSFQHLCCVLRFWHRPSYNTLILVLEIWFEWLIFSNFETYASHHWTLEVSALAIIFSHWIWWLAGILALWRDVPRMDETGSIDMTKGEEEEGQSDAVSVDLWKDH